MDKALLIFIRNPVKGKVKTRLAKDIGDSNALTIYHYLLAHTRKISMSVQAERFLFYDEAINYDDDWPESNFQKNLQNSDHLVSRMLHAFQTAFAQGHTHMIIIGSDCVDLNSELIEDAFIALKDHDFVIGPAKDGGYYLLGMKYPEAKLFENKQWSTASVFNDTLKDINHLSKTVFVLPKISDIDTVSDLNDKLKCLIATP